MTVMTFAIGGFSAWMPDYIFLDRRAEFPSSQNLLGNIDLTFGGISAASWVAGHAVRRLGWRQTAGAFSQLLLSRFRNGNVALRSGDHRRDLRSFPDGLADDLYCGLFPFL